MMVLILIAQLAGSSFAMAAEPVEQPPVDMLKIRDPFKRPTVTDNKDAVPRTELELFGADTLKMLGVITGPQEVKALVLAPNGKTYYVTEKTKVGTRKGVISKITTDKVKIKEKIVNVLGQEEDVDTELTLPPEQKEGAPSQ